MFPGVCIAIPHWRDNGKQFSMRRSTLMEPRNLQFMTEACHGQCLRGSPEQVIRRVCTDSRHVHAADLFVALRGERFDGHAFLSEVMQKGIAAAVVERDHALPSLEDCGLIVVDNTRKAYGQMAARYRRDFSLPIIAVAGSNGKTTTKELIAAVLSQHYRTLASQGSFNNDIGVPATLLELNKEHEVAVLELGTNHPGELQHLITLAAPLYGVIPSIGREHLEFFGDLDGVIAEEGMLGELLPPGGKLFLNGDTPGAAELTRRSAVPCVTVGFGPGAMWRVMTVRQESSGSSFELLAPEAGFCREFRIGLLGRHQIVNAALAIAVGAQLGLAPDAVQNGLLACRPAKMRLQLWASQGVQVLDDTYNANADSMRAALETLRDLPCRGRRIAVLGEMGELGVHARSAHAEVGAYAVRMGVDQLFTVGELAVTTAQSARQAGLENVQHFANAETAAGAITQLVRPEDLVLLKASRAAALERIAERLRQERAPQNDVSQGQKGSGLQRSVG